ncbi:MAG: hypothetical protein R2708_26860 [Vicinamibacterales bacterium]
MSPAGACHALVVVGLVAAIGCGPAAPPAPPERFDTFVDAFLDHFASVSPGSIAAGNGLHRYDDRLEDFGALVVASEIDGWRTLAARLATSRWRRCRPTSGSTTGSPPA